MYATKRALSEFSGAIGSDDKQTIEFDLTTMQKCIDENGTSEDLRKAISNLESSAHRIAELIYGGHSAEEGDGEPLPEEPEAEDLAQEPAPDEPVQEGEEEQ